MISTFGAISTVTYWSSSFEIGRAMPPAVTTSSPFCSASSIALRFLRASSAAAGSAGSRTRRRSRPSAGTSSASPPRRGAWAPARYAGEISTTDVSGSRCAVQGRHDGRGGRRRGCASNRAASTPRTRKRPRSRNQPVILARTLRSAREPRDVVGEACRRAIAARSSAHQRRGSSSRLWMVLSRAPRISLTRCRWCR